MTPSTGRQLPGRLAANRTGPPPASSSQLRRTHDPPMLPASDPTRFVASIDGTDPIDDPRDVQTPAEVRDHRQRTQLFLQSGDVRDLRPRPA